MDSCITQLEVQGPSRTCDESQEEKRHICLGGVYVLDIYIYGPENGLVTRLVIVMSINDMEKAWPEYGVTRYIVPASRPSCIGWHIRKATLVQFALPRKVDIRLHGRKFKRPWREAGPSNRLDDEVDSDQ